MIRVFLIDSSAVFRTYLKGLFDNDPQIELLGFAFDPKLAERLLQKKSPDVILLDVDLPKMDCSAFVRTIMETRPTPVFILTSDSDASISRSMEALNAGALQIVPKPRTGLKRYSKEEEELLINSIKSVGGTARRKLSEVNKQARGTDTRRRAVKEKLTADVILPAMSIQALNRVTQRIIAIGTSMGGTKALELVLSKLPMLTPGILVVQHMPEKFTAAYAERLNRLCKIEVHEARDGDEVMPGVALLAPGNKHMLLKRVNRDYYIELKDGPPVCRHKPSVDVLFRSVANSAGFNATGVIMTGMGDDGAQGMLELHNSGATTIAQDEESCVVFGMPGEAIKRGAADKIVPLDKIAATIMESAEKESGKLPKKPK